MNWNQTLIQCRGWKRILMHMTPNTEFFSTISKTYLQFIRHWFPVMQQQRQVFPQHQLQFGPFVCHALYLSFHEVCLQLYRYQIPFLCNEDQEKIELELLKCWLFMSYLNNGQYELSRNFNEPLCAPYSFVLCVTYDINNHFMFEFNHFKGKMGK